MGKQGKFFDYGSLSLSAETLAVERRLKSCMLMNISFDILCVMLMQRKCMERYASGSDGIYLSAHSREELQMISPCAPRLTNASWNGSRALYVGEWEMKPVSSLILEIS